MTFPELPPLKLPALPSLPSRSFADHERYIIQLRDAMKARESILVAEIERLRAECEAMRQHIADYKIHISDNQPDDDLETA